MSGLNVLIVGTGQMGKAIAEQLRIKNHSIVGEVGSQGDSQGRNLQEVCQAEGETIDIAIEFSLPEAAHDNVKTILDARIPVVCGTTGWEPDTLESTATENGVALLHAANFSIGVAVMKKATELMSSAFRPFPDFEPAMFERHHNRKKDAPSGTAKMLGRVVEEHSSCDNLQITSVRQGQIAGEHSLIFEGQAESLEIVHRAHSRQIFAIGAVLAAEWLAGEQLQGLVDFETFLERSLQWKTVV